MVVDWIISDLVGLLGLSEAYELNRCHSTLVQQLEETMLPVGAWLPEVDHSSWVGDDLSLPVDPLSVALHIQLLNMGSELAQGLTIRNDSPGRVALNSRAMETDQS